MIFLFPRLNVPTPNIMCGGARCENPESCRPNTHPSKIYNQQTTDNRHPPQISNRNTKPELRSPQLQKNPASMLSFNKANQQIISNFSGKLGQLPARGQAGTTASTFTTTTFFEPPHVLHLTTIRNHISYCSECTELISNCH